MTTADDLNRYFELREMSQKLHMASCWMRGILSFVESENIILDDETLKFVKSMDRISNRVYEVSMALSDEAKEMLSMDPTVPTPDPDDEPDNRLTGTVVEFLSRPQMLNMILRTSLLEPANKSTIMNYPAGSAENKGKRLRELEDAGLIAIDKFRKIRNEKTVMLTRKGDAVVRHLSDIQHIITGAN